MKRSLSSVVMFSSAELSVAAQPRTSGQQLSATGIPSTFHPIQPALPAIFSAQFQPLL
jgi:hypothetical protein